MAPESQDAEPQDRKFVGSALIYEAESFEEARRLVEADVYWKENVVSDVCYYDFSITLTTSWKVGQGKIGHSSYPHGDYPPRASWCHSTNVGRPGLTKIQEMLAKCI